MGIVIMIVQFIVALSILVALHELGHMLPALWFGMRVEKYYIGFPPKVFSFVRKGIEYGLGSIPLGGFVKISGMIDESLDTKNLNKDPEPWEFRAKPAWQRFIVMAGGVTVNILFGIMVYAFILFNWGTSRVPITEVKNGIMVSDVTEKLGFKNGDKILEINQKPVLYLNEILSPMGFIDGDATYLVERNGRKVEIKVPLETLNSLDPNRPFLSDRIGLVVTGLEESGGAEKAGLKVGDKIVGLNGVNLSFLDEIAPLLDMNKSKTVNLSVMRDGKNLSISALVSEGGKLGFYPGNEFSYKFENQKYTLGESLLEAPKFGYSMIRTNVLVFKNIFLGKINPAKVIGGPVNTAKQFGKEFYFEKFCLLLALISIMLGFMNLLPIPALDGGHIVFLIYEMVFRRKPSEKVMEVSQKIGMAFLFTLMILVTCKDIFFNN